MVANSLPTDPPPPPTQVSEIKIHFSECGHGVYQIKWNHKCSNMQAHILSLHTH